MKKIIYLVFIAAVMAACAPKEPQFNITGKIAGADSVTFILQKRVDGKTVKLDSAMSLNGVFKMKGAVKYPESVTLVAKEKRKSKPFFIENAEIVITGVLDSLSFAKVTGSKTHDESIAYQESLKQFDDKFSALNEEYKVAREAKDKAKLEEINKRGEEIDKEETAFTKEYIKTHPASYFTPMLLGNLFYSTEPDELEAIMNTLDTNVAKIPVVLTLKERIVVMKTVAIGQIAPDFTLNDVNDKPVALSSMFGKSKLLLIDFWASWCGPCRAENPNVVKVWKEFNKKGFDVFGVSLDQPGAKEKWMQAIKDDKLTWTHVSDLKYWDCAAAKLYAVRAIPANFLLDETGKIIGKNLRGDALYNKVKELLEVKK
jgi:peroxiredoxin